jgi:integrase/recombinase XerD
VSGAAFANNFIAEKFAAAERDLFDVQTGSIKQDSLFEKKERFTLDQAFTRELVRLKAEGKAGSYNKVEGFKKQLKVFTDIKVLNLQDMDYAWFHSLAAYFKKIGNIGATTQKKIKTIRAVVAKYSPTPMSEELKAFKVPEKKSIKQKLSGQELEALETLELPEGDKIEAVRDLFLLQVYLRGIRVGDLLQAYSESFKDGLFNYKDDKTGQSFSIKLIQKAQVIVDRYSGRYERLFPIMQWTANKKLSAFENKQARMKQKEICTAVVNKYLKMIGTMAGIDKPLSSHIARHTFARMAIDKINNPMVTMELLGHSSLAIHQQYLNDIRKNDVLDQAADDIFS